MLQDFASAALFTEAQLNELAQRLAHKLLQNQQRLVTAESCTGGWIAKVLTDLAGSSAWFEGGLVSYSNLAKQNLLGVSAATLQAHGAVSAECVQAMAIGALDRSTAHQSVAVSGIAGPAGGSPEKPVGTVWVGWAQRTSDTPHADSRRFQFAGDREQVRRATVAAALQILLDNNSTKTT